MVVIVVSPHPPPLRHVREPAAVREAVGSELVHHHGEREAPPGRGVLQHRHFRPSKKRKNKGGKHGHTHIHDGKIRSKGGTAVVSRLVYVQDWRIFIGHQSASAIDFTKRCPRTTRFFSSLGCETDIVSFVTRLDKTHTHTRPYTKMVSGENDVRPRG